MLATQEPSTDLFDVVIIGAGAAGITLALHLGQAGVQTALVEGGDYELSTASQDLYQGFNHGIDYSLTGMRLRFFGGTTNHWSGWCRPLDPATFDPRDTIDYPGWAIDKADLDPYLDDAQKILDVQPALPWEPNDSQKQPDFHPYLEQASFKEVYWKWSPPTRLKAKYLDTLQADPNITISVGDSLVDFEFTDEGEITGAILRNIHNGSFRTVRGKLFVLACGAIENARLLLHINAINAVDFGNQSGQLGKNFMEHPHFYNAGQVVIFDQSYDQSIPVQSKGYRFFIPTNDFVKTNQILRSSIRFRMLEKEKDRQIFIRELAAISHLEPQAHWQVANIDVASEQIPSAINTVTLSDETDRLNIHKAILHWELEDIDYESVRKMLLHFAEFIIDTDLGRCKLEPWITNLNVKKLPLGGGHQMGTTRMADNEADGVVDTDCKLFGTKNLYIAGSSVFTTGGYTNPTLTIVQLALRLAQHLQGRLQT